MALLRDLGEGIERKKAQRRIIRGEGVGRGQLRIEEGKLYF